MLCRSGCNRGTQEQNQPGGKHPLPEKCISWRIFYVLPALFYPWHCGCIFLGKLVSSYIDHDSDRFVSAVADRYPQKAKLKPHQIVPQPDDINLIPEVVAAEDDIIEYRRQMHMYPELKYEEVRYF